MAQLAVLAPYFQAATTVLSVYSAAKQGMDAKAAANREALQLERAANEQQVEAQMLAMRERRKTRYLRSRTLAVAGASGAGVSDKTVSDILTGIDTQGEMSALNALYNGDTEASALRSRAAARRKEGRAAMTGGLLKAGTKALTAVVEYSESNPSFFQKYGGDRAQRMGLGTGYSDFADESMYSRGLA